MESTEFVADFVTTAGAVNGERLTVSGDCLPMLTKMAPRNVMPSLFIVCNSKGGVHSVHSPQSVFLLHTHPQSLLLEQMTKRRLH